VTTLLTALLWLVGGTLIALPVPIIAAIASSPAVIVSERTFKQRGVLPTWGVLLTAACVLYVLLAFSAFVVESARPSLAAIHGPSKYLLWAIAFFVAGLPGWMMLRDSPGATPTMRGAVPIGVPLSDAGFLVFVFFPSVLRFAWGWVPHL